MLSINGQNYIICEKYDEDEDEDEDEDNYNWDDIFPYVDYEY